MKFAFISAEKADDQEVAWMCRQLGVSRSGYYAWLTRPESTHAREDRRLAVLVRVSHERSRGTYGRPRVHADLRHDGETVSNKRVARIMRQQGLKARGRRRYKHTTDSAHDHPVADNILARRFEADAPNQRWVGDTTELLIGEGRTKLYLAAIVDLFARFVVGWAVSAVNDRHLTLKALEMAVRRRCPDAGLLHHSDRGSPYAAEAYQRALEAKGIICSMSRRGNCHDNAAMESWFSTLKFELGERFPSYAIAKEQLFDYIEVFYNQRRRHSSIAYKSPAEHERAFGSVQLAA